MRTLSSQLCRWAQPSATSLEWPCWWSTVKRWWCRWWSSKRQRRKMVRFSSLRLLKVTRRWRKPMGRPSTPLQDLQTSAPSSTGRSSSCPTALSTTTLVCSSPLRWSRELCRSTLSTNGIETVIDAPSLHQYLHQHCSVIEEQPKTDCCSSSQVSYEYLLNFFLEASPFVISKNHYLSSISN